MPHHIIICINYKLHNALRRSWSLREMETIKDPAMLLSLANSIAIVGNTAYFYKQMEAMRLDMVKISQTLNGVVKKLAEIEKGEQNRGEALHTLNNQVKDLNTAIEEIPSFADFQDLDVDVDAVVETLNEQGIAVERPSQTPRSHKYDRRNGSRRTDDFEDRSASARRKPPPQRREEPKRAPPRKKELARPTRQPKGGEYDDDEPESDEDVIKALRQGHN
jgi:cell fate (sporulation/competence/biofilm development) regulator YmcA (YheA/YmcA/DUF963 family)